MLAQLPDFLTLVNDILQATIVVFGSAVALYNLPHSLHDRVTRAFNSLLFFVVIVYFTEVLVTRTTLAILAEPWMRLEWIGIAMVPAAQFHLADALLVTTGNISPRRRLLVRIWYLTGAAFFLLAIFTNLIVGDLISIDHAARFQPGPLFLLFTVYYWLIALTTIYLVWRARERCITNTTRRRMTMILITFMAAPLSVFPYLLFTGNTNTEVPVFFWIVLIAGNLTVGVMFAFLTYYISYFGTGVHGFAGRCITTLPPSRRHLPSGNYGMAAILPHPAGAAVYRAPEGNQFNDSDAFRTFCTDRIEVFEFKLDLSWRRQVFIFNTGYVHQAVRPNNGLVAIFQQESNIFR
jgi:hypothetical protein